MIRGKVFFSSINDLNEVAGKSSEILGFRISIHRERLCEPCLQGNDEPAESDTAYIEIFTYRTEKGEAASDFVIE
jgi:hypothetical protein